MDIENNKKMEEILNSLDGCQRAGAPDFFYTRLKAKMEKGLEPSTAQSWVLRPVYAVAVLLVVLLINAVVIFNNNNSSFEEKASVDTEVFQSIAAEYKLNDNNTLYDLNQDK